MAEPTIGELVTEIAALRRRVERIDDVVNAHAEAIAKRRLETSRLGASLASVIAAVDRARAGEHSA